MLFLPNVSVKLLSTVWPNTVHMLCSHSRLGLLGPKLSRGDGGDKFNYSTPPFIVSCNNYI